MEDKYSLKLFHTLLTSVWDKEIMPKEWNTGLICLIFKKGNKFDCNNYRGVTLRNVAYKVFSNIVSKCINPLKPKLVYMLFKNSVRTSKRTPHFTITKINWLMLFKFNPLKPKLV
jgi:hypothetical protein